MLGAKVDRGGVVAEVAQHWSTPIAPLFWTSATVPEWSTIAAAVPLSPLRVAAMVPQLKIAFTVAPLSIRIACAAARSAPPPWAMIVPALTICGTDAPGADVDRGRVGAVRLGGDRAALVMPPAMVTALAEPADRTCRSR